MYKKLATAALLVASLGAAHAYVPASIRLVGYCDYFTDLTTEGSTGAAGVWQNLDCAGSSATGGGAQVRAGADIRIGYVLGTSGVAPFTGGKELTWWIKDDKTWQLFDYQGVLLNSGTWATRLQSDALVPSNKSVLSGQ